MVNLIFVLMNFTFLTEQNIVSFIRFIKEEYKKNYY